MRVAIYGRVSTSHQVDHQTIEQQLERLSAHVHAHAAEGWVLDPGHVFRDDGYSGATLACPGLDRLRDAVKSRECDRVLVTAPDRLARNYVHQMVLLEEWARFGCIAEFLGRPMSDDGTVNLSIASAAMAASSVSTSSTKASTSENASHDAGVVHAG